MNQPLLEKPTFEQLLEATKSLPAFEITGEAALGCAIAAGVPIVTKEENGKIIVTTAHPVCVMCDGGRIIVFSQPE